VPVVLIETKDAAYRIRDDIKILSETHTDLLGQILISIRRANELQVAASVQHTRTDFRQLQEYHQSLASQLPLTGGSQILCLRNLSSTSTVSAMWTRNSRTLHIGLGFLTITKSSKRQWEGRGSRELHVSDAQETEITFLPASWLLRTGIGFTIRQLPPNLFGSNIQLSLRPITVISADNPIIEAMRSGSLRRVRALISDGKAHPHDLLPDGKTLLHKCLWEMYEQANPGDEMHTSEFTIGDIRSHWGKPLAEDVIESCVCLKSQIGF
jgi:hypothetical protein